MKRSAALSEQSGSEKTFDGFALPTSNYFRMPNEWTDITASINNLAELKVVEYVLRHTWGYHEYGGEKTISVDEFMYGRKRADGTRMDKGTRLSEQSVRNGIERAIAHGFLICEVDDRDKARIKKSYALKMQQSEVKDLDPQVQTLDPSKGRGQKVRPPKSRPRTPTSLTSDSQNLDPGVPNVRPRSGKDTSERHQRNTPKKEREVPGQQPPSASSLSPSGNALLSNLTEQESTFWTRWCSVSGSAYESLNQNAYSHVKFLAGKALSTEELQSLYDYKYAQIREYSASLGKPAIPPRLGNLVKAYPEWQKTREQKDRERVEEQEQRGFVPGTGHLRNYTEERLAGKAEPITYAPLPTQRRDRSSTAQKGNIDFDDTLARLRNR